MYHLKRDAEAEISSLPPNILNCFFKLAIYAELTRIKNLSSGPQSGSYEPLRVVL